MRERARAPAKVNLLLHVHERDAAGYHALDTLFCALELSDELTIDLEAGDTVTLEVEGADLGPVEKNLAVRAARAFLHAAGQERQVSIRLRKHIPHGGGLGGGSSDAATVLIAMDRLMPGAVAASELEGAARALGSDVPFFLTGRPFAWGGGRGELLSPAPALPSVPVLLAIPPFAVPTAEAYAWLDADRAAADPMTAPPDRVRVETASWEQLAAVAANDFEPPIFRRYPLLREVRDQLAAEGALLSLLAGSGSTVFGLFADDDRAAAATAALRARFPDIRLELTRTASR